MKPKDKRFKKKNLVSVTSKVHEACYARLSNTLYKEWCKRMVDSLNLVEFFVRKVSIINKT